MFWLKYISVFPKRVGVDQPAIQKAFIIQSMGTWMQGQLQILK